MHSSDRPIVVLETPSRSCIHGMWAIQVPIIAPFTAKTANVAQRGVIGGGYSRPRFVAS